MKPTLKIVLFILLSLFLNVIISFSTSMKEMSLKEICGYSSDIVVAEVISFNSFYKDESRKQIFSEVSLKIENSIKGESKENDILKMTIPGGQINGIRTFIVGAPAYKTGENTLLFLKKNISENLHVNYLIVGLSQGKYNIIEENGEKTVIREQLEDNLKLDEKSNLPITKTKSLKLETFINVINEIITNK
jgi:hypothetical protein